MKQLRILIPLLMAIFSSAGYAQDSCPVGLKRLNPGEPCIPETLFNYLYCLKNSGGGVIEITKKSDSSDSKGLEISVGGKGSGVVISGEGNVAVKKSDANRIVQEVSKKIDPTLAANCKSLVEAPPPQKVSLDFKALLGIDGRIGNSRSELRQLLPEAKWNTDQKGTLYATAAGTLQGIPGDVYYWFNDDQVTRMTFVSAADGANWTTFNNRSSGWEESVNNRNGQPLTYAAAKQRCEPLKQVKSTLARELGSATRVIEPESNSDPTVNETKPKTVRLAQQTGWKSEYQSQGVKVVADYFLYYWDIDIQNTNTNYTKKMNYHCRLMLQLTNV
jgi:hypothetical protein